MAILDHYHAKLAEQNMSEAEVIGERNPNGHLERVTSSGKSSVQDRLVLRSPMTSASDIFCAASFVW